MFAQNQQRDEKSFVLLDGVAAYPEVFVSEYRQKGYWKGQTITNFFAECVQKYADNIAIIDGEQQYSYQQLKQKIEQFAAYLQQKGYQSGDRVVIQLPNIAEFFIAYFATIQLGMLPVMSLPAHRHSEVIHFINQTAAKLYICADKYQGFDYRDLARQSRQNCATLQQVIVVGDAEEFTAWHDTVSHTIDNSLINPVSQAGQVAFFQLSGGSTGTPKLIPRTHDDYLYSIRASAEICELNQSTKMLMVLPVAHNFSLSSPGSLGLFYAGGTLVLAQNAAPDSCFPLIIQHKITNVALVPALVVAWTEAIQQQGQEHIFNQINVLQVGGARLADALARQLIEQYDCYLQQVFGMAEGLVNYTRYDDPIETIVATQGKPISPDDEIRIVDDEDQDVKAGEIGHLLTRGPYTIRGYYQADDHNQRSFTQDGFYRTGDLVRLTVDGNIVVEGRSKDQINRGGEKIATEEVEQILNQHQQVIQSALVAMPDRVLGEKSCAFIEWRSTDADVSKMRLQMQLKQFIQHAGLATFKIPDRIEFVEEMPYTALGKIDKKVLRQRLLAEAQ